MVRAGNAHWALWCVAAAATCGCITPTPWDSPPTSAAPGPPLGNWQQAMRGIPYGPLGPGTNAAASPGDSLPPGAALNGAGDSSAPWATRTAGSAFSGATMLASWQHAKESVAGAFRIEPKVIAADDPIKLDSSPANANAAAAELHYRAGRVLETQKNGLESAAAHYRDALARTPNDGKLLSSYARVQDRMGNVAEADALYRRAIDLNPNDASCYNDLAMCHARHGNLDLALGHLQRALKLDPANKLYRNNMALVLVDAGRPNDAFENLVAAHGEAVAHYNLGYMLLERNAREAAAEQFQKALQKNPQLDVARQMLAEIQAASPTMVSGPGAVAASGIQLPLMRLPETRSTTNLARQRGVGDAFR